jgi:FkbM family methyltransferase
MTKLTYDFGANNGDDIPYYLMKSDLVIAVEANPVLCRLIEDRFQCEIKSGRLVIENCVLTAEDESPEVAFYIHKHNHVLSQFPKPSPSSAEQYEKVWLPSKSATSIVMTYGSPHYVKIDIEHYDSQILRALFAKGIYPPFVSAESHSIEVFSLLVSMGRYNAFKLVDGSTVSQVYSERLILRGQDKVRYSFPFHSAGPFGNDVDGQWMSADNFFILLAFKGLGWKDIHATNQEAANPSAVPSRRDYFRLLILNKIKKLAPHPVIRTLKWFASLLS